MSSSEYIPVSGDPKSTVSLVITIRNEVNSLPPLLESIAAQSMQPSEIIIVDGGSTDGSLTVLDQWSQALPLDVVVAEGANISTGRNIGLRRASSELVAITDAGVRLDPRWVEELVLTLTQQTLPVDVASGFFVPDSQGDFEAALAATTLPDADEIDRAAFLPSSRSVAFRRSWFEAGVSYPEWLDYCEDLIFDLRLKRAGARFAFQPAAVVSFRPRTTVASFWRQYYLYARGDGKAGLFFRRHLLRYIAYLLVLPSVVVVRNPIWRVLVLLGAIGYMRRPLIRLWRRTGRDPMRTARLFPLAVALRAVGDVAKMAGYPVGLLWRRRQYRLRDDWRSIP